MDEVKKFICHSYHVSSIAMSLGWFPGARYTNLRDIRKYDRLGFLDIDWVSYNYQRHLKVTKDTRPMFTVARDILNIAELDEVLSQAHELSQWADNVIIIPKDPKLITMLPDVIPTQFILGYSVPTKYGKTTLPFKCFRKRRVHLLGGHPLRQRSIARYMNVISLDCNRFTIDATYGDYFDGQIFKPHLVGGYTNCIKDSIISINELWKNYDNGIKMNGARLDYDSIVINKAKIENIKAIKEIADGNRKGIGFLREAALKQSIEMGEVFVAKYQDKIIGFQTYHHRKKDYQTTLYQKCVTQEYRRQGVGRKLVDSVVDESRKKGRKYILVKCPVDLEANEFHNSYGFSLIKTEKGKRRDINLWGLEL